MGGLFFYFEAVRTDLTEMLRAGRPVTERAGRRQTVVGARAEQAEGVERATGLDRDARVGECYVLAAASATVAREVASQTKGRGGIESGAAAARETSGRGRWYPVT